MPHALNRSSVVVARRGLNEWHDRSARSRRDQITVWTLGPRGRARLSGPLDRQRMPDLQTRGCGPSLRGDKFAERQELRFRVLVLVPSRDPCVDRDTKQG